jgi:hypothetical protein
LGEETLFEERASIDELFLDATAYCCAAGDERNSTASRITFEQALENTVKVGNPDLREDDPSSC